MAPLVVLIISFLILLALKFFLTKQFSISQVGRLAMAVMLVFTGASHFIKTEEMVQMMPDFFPYKLFFVYLTGALEIGAAVGLVYQRWAKFTSVALIAFFVLVLPANIIGSLKRVELGGMENGPAYLFFRVPLQVFLICWVYYFGIYRLGKNAVGGLNHTHMSDVNR
jgi:uncharacterized membrane protein